MSDDVELEEGEIHDILRNDRRRAVIEFLSTSNDHVTIRELSEHIAAVESGEDPPPRNVRQSVYVSLHQTHLPKLEGLGVVKYDTDSKDVRLHDRATTVEAYMNRHQQGTGRSRFSLAYFVVGALGLLLATVSVIADSVAGLRPNGVLVVLFGVVTALGAYQSWSQSTS
ncbi:DUF7344 domain-containing protein [Halalkalicoccus jeotgali]|uniref:DUF7344 domain-containing protein n=1 Tax=Halalkalicoccus jeotgali (strain DSM 18796 / CECT 7217 / JCM 14584 / KCTC 4019 / B3) TaxID=795797 RepID=D8J358_HALJB|nr:hypothetical protein [Halalkalicoccus jeotgali]ADJ15165.1 hypothetical protein HacjB3_08910 [Halalkalicoccus jeotgali B3]ELY35115.1 hypothetical protein C497_13770 [Halalkalicoccus jeotgali B3]